MAKLPTQELAKSAGYRVFALIGAVLIGPAPIAGATVPAPAHIASYDDPDPNPTPLIQAPPDVSDPTNPGQKALSPQHHRSHHRAPI